MFKKPFPIFTKLMFVCSSIILIFFLVGFIMSPFISKKMENNNYCFSNSIEMSSFENSLTDKDIPYKKISDNVISVPSKWSSVADNFFQKYYK